MRFWRRFVITVSLCLLFAAQPRPAQSTVPWKVAIQAGLDSYHRADYFNAVALWNTALHQHPPKAVEIELHQYLARAQQALGETYRAIDHFDWLMEYYRHQAKSDPGNLANHPGPNSQTLTPQALDSQAPDLQTLDPQSAEVKWGQMQVEQAHNYAQVGHYLQSLYLLCGSPQKRSALLESEAFFGPSSSFEQPSSAQSSLEQPLLEQSSLEQPSSPEAEVVLADLSCRSESAVAIALRRGDQRSLSTALVSLGNIQRLRGKNESAIQIFNRALSADIKTTVFQRSLIYEGLGAIQAAESARDIRLADFAQLQGEEEVREAWLDLALEKNQVALESLDRSWEMLFSSSSNDSAAFYRVKNRLNAMMMQRRMDSESAPSFTIRVKDSLNHLHRELQTLPLSREKVHSLVRLANLTQELPEQAYDLDLFQFQPILLETERLRRANLNLPAFRAEAPSFCAKAQPQTRSLLREAWTTAKRLQDHRAQSFIAGRLGHLYECQSNFEAAFNWTREAQILAPSQEDRFLWDWQAARLWVAQNNSSQALAAYEETLRTLRGIRGELATASYEFQLDFRETIKPIYQDLINLRMQFYRTATTKGWTSSTSPTSTSPTSTNSASTSSTSTSSVSVRPVMKPVSTSHTTIAQSTDTASNSSTVSRSISPNDGPSTELSTELYPSQLGYPAYRARSKTPPVQHSFDLEDIVHSLDELHIFELQNYLGEGCDLPPPQPLTSYDNTTAFISTYIQQNHLSVILSLPQAEQDEEDRYYMRSQLYEREQDREKLIKQVNRLRQWLGKRSDRSNRWRADAKDLYDKLIRPLEPALEAAQIKTLVFMHDGILRSLPMAPLFDGQNFLVEHYALAHTPALSLTNPEPTPLDPSQHLLAYGLSQAAVVELTPRSRYFAPLPFVETELEGLQDQLTNVQVRLNNNFNFQKIRQDLEQFSPQILHLATHARFGFDAKQTFLVMGRKQAKSSQEPAAPEETPPPATSPDLATHGTKWHQANHKSMNEPLTLARLTELVQEQPGLLKLLVLSACDTATGSERDILGIAGTAFQTGIWSTLASLWQVDDQATSQLINGFYQNLGQGQSRAIALQHTQKDWLNRVTDPAYRHPGYWAPFILVGNWL